MNKWNKRFLRVAREVSSWSKDGKHRVGAVLVNESNRIVSTGYNGPPSNVRGVICKDGQVVHAEANCIVNAAQSLKGCTIYVYPFMPCSRCAGLLIQSGVKKIVTLDQGISKKWNPEISLEMLRKNKVKIVVIKGQAL